MGVGVGESVPERHKPGKKMQMKPWFLRKYLIFKFSNWTFIILFTVMRGGGRKEEKKEIAYRTGEDTYMCPRWNTSDPLPPSWLPHSLLLPHLVVKHFFFYLNKPIAQGLMKNQWKMRTVGVPLVMQWKQIRRGAMRVQASISGLQIWCCHGLWYEWQTQLGSCVAVTLVWAGSYAPI